MIIAPLLSFPIGAVLGYLKGWSLLKPTAKSVLGFVPIVIVPALYLRDDPELSRILVVGIGTTYLALLLGALLGSFVRRLTNHEPS
ncbi:hypothetical protein [Methylorubrum podarium]|uniref:hypothetical protein n=1 Tax=Methylorubrum podarium TaxID=200476 RepID=UPI001EE18CB5|nr:hypothetical protein [Methylorubrum podarium]GJE68954.1 hypothetical protein CHKEEEPN_0477 [Methylorubrum podarium]